MSAPTLRRTHNLLKHNLMILAVKEVQAFNARNRSEVSPATRESDANVIRLLTEALKNLGDSVGADDHATPDAEGASSEPGNSAA